MPRFVTKASNEGVCSCDCEEAIASYPAQTARPWSGCGWLFTCMTCRKAFTYGRVVEIDEDLARFLRTDLTRLGLVANVLTITERANFLIKQLKPFELGDEVVYLDGRYLPVDKAPARFKGWYAHHSLKELPHKARDAELLSETLGTAEYWQSRARLAS